MLDRSDAVTASIARLLGVGTIVVVAVVTAGTALGALAGHTPVRDRGPALVPTQLPEDLAALRPEALLWAGIILTVLLPTARVCLALFGFARAGDVRSVLVSTGILGILAISVALALVTRPA